METYRIQIGDCVRQLPICPINENLSIAGFVMLGDVELTEACAKELLKICPEHDIIVTAETKGITLAHEMARIGCGDYIVARKGIKAYMQNPVSVEVKSITTEDVQKLYLAKADYDKLKDKRVLIVDQYRRVFGSNSETAFTIFGEYCRQCCCVGRRRCR